MRAIKRLRQLLAIGQQELAAKSGLSVRQLARIEAGQQVVNEKTSQGVDAGFDAILGARLKEEVQECQPEKPKTTD